MSTNGWSLYKAAKLSVLRLAKRAGMSTRVRDSDWRSERLLIIAYHGVSIADEHECDAELYITPALLRARLTALRNGGYQVLPFSVAIQRLYAGTLPPRAVALTFDDGTHDFAAVVVPILREFQMPATVYLTTYYADRGGPVFDTMSSYLMWCARGRTISGEGITLHGRPLDLHTRAGIEQAAEDVYRFSRERDLTSDEKDRVLEEIAARGDVDYQRIVAQRLFHIMTPAEVSSLPRDLIDVQLHTHRHRVPLNHDLFRREIEDNRQSLERMGINGTRGHFCYPSGITDPSFLPWLQEASVASATTCFVGLASKKDNPLMLPRLIDTTALTQLEFDGWLTGVSEFIPKRRGTAGPA
ncbi:MAG: polysaccharide deacetylase family protein [Gemmatimonadaceae bacterium]